MKRYLRGKYSGGENGSCNEWAAECPGRALARRWYVSVLAGTELLPGGVSGAKPCTIPAPLTLQVQTALKIIALKTFLRPVLDEALSCD